jgi:hypothetical protein
VFLFLPFPFRLILIHRGGSASQLVISGRKGFSVAFSVSFYHGMVHTFTFLLVVQTHCLFFCIGGPLIHF